jgi:hypothetical protein
MIKIIDIYSGNEWWNPQKALSDGYTGVIFKAGQGVLPDVPRIHPSWAKDAHDAGLFVGWYWMMDSRYKPSRQVDMLVKTLGTSFGELGIYADCEKPNLAMKDADYWKTLYPGMKHIVDFIYLLEIQTRIRAGVYTSPGFWNLINQRPNQTYINYLAKSRLWTAQYPWIYIPGISKPTRYGGWDKHTFWQYKERPDINLYNGTDEEFNTEFSGMFVPPTEPPAYTVMYVNASIGLNVRDEPNGDKIGALRNHARVEVKTTMSGWSEIISADESPMSGWVSSQYLII